MDRLARTLPDWEHLSPEIKNIVAWLQENGAQVETGNKDDWGIVPVEEDGQLQCVDGRPPKHKKLKRGPKFPGGLEGVAYFVAKGQGSPKIEEEHVTLAAQMVEKAGYKPGVHDMGAHLHCGHATLVSKNQFPIQLGIAPERIAEIAGANKGENPELAGDHAERGVVLNFAANTTREPDGDNQMFCVDLWFAKLLGLSPEEVAIHSAETVKKLGSDAWKKVVIVL